MREREGGDGPARRALCLPASVDRRPCRLPCRLAAFGGAEAFNWPASAGYGSYGKKKHHKEREFEPAEPAEAFVLTNSWAVNGRH